MWRFEAVDVFPKNCVTKKLWEKKCVKMRQGNDVKSYREREREREREVRENERERRYYST